MQILLETFFVKIENNSLLYCRNIIHIDDVDTDPDGLIVEMIDGNNSNVPKILKNEYIIHSTSWRYEQIGKIVLTYLIYSDFIDFKNIEVKVVEFNDLSIAKSSSHKKPRPETITEINVLAHAIRHLAYLVNHCDHDNYKSMLSSKTLKSIDRLREIPAGEIGL